MAAWGADKTGYGTKWPNFDRSPLEPPADLQRGYARTYATAVAGEAISMHFNVSRRAVRLEYVRAHG